MKGSLTSISGCDGNNLTRGKSESPRLCGIKSGMLHVSLLDQLQGLFTRHLLHGGGI